MPPLAARAHSDDSLPALTTDLEVRCDAPVVHVGGEIDMSTVGALADAITSAEMKLDPGERHPVVVVDLHDVTFLGAEGLRTLVAAGNRIARAGGSMRVVAPNGGGIVRRLLDLSGVGALLDLFDSVESALPSVGD